MLGVPVPSWILGLVVSVLLGSLFHLWKNGGPGRLIMFIVVSLFGFWVGHFLAVAFSWDLFSVGVLRLGVGVIFSVVFLFVGDWLSLD